MKQHFRKAPVKPSIKETKVSAPDKASGKGIATAMMTGNKFLRASTSHDTRTEKGAISHSSTGNIFVDDFAKAGTYRDRPTEEIEATIARLWETHPETALRATLYLRLITRKTHGPFATETVQKGQGNKDESLRRLLWVAKTHPETFYKNLWLYPAIGSWKDLWILMGIDIHGVINKEKVFDVMKLGLETEGVKDLVLKYMPSIKASSRCTTDRAYTLNGLAKNFAKYLGLNQKEYRILKSSGKAHIFQQQISRGFFDLIDFNMIPGKALLSMVGGKFLATSKLEEKYNDWIMSQPIAKFTGYPYELMAKVGEFGWVNRINNMKPYLEHTINKQFDGLIAKANQDEGGITGNVWCALDTSGSMATTVANKITAYEVCVSLGVYFATLNTGAFHKNVIMFDNESQKLQLGGTFIDMVKQVVTANTAWGTTNFQSVIDEIIRIRLRNPNVPIADYPETLIVVSDMQFDGAGDEEFEKTNHETAMSKLAMVGLPPITIIWWFVTGRGTDFPSTIDDKGTVMLGGFDGAIISGVLGGSPREEGKPLDMVEVFDNAISQPLLLQAKV